ncbi:MAG: DUF424 family protein [Candidatus Micrarchaeia archaeon]
MFAKVHKCAGAGGEVRRIVAVCDASLLGKRFEAKGRVLDLKAHRAFYEGERASVARVAELLDGCENANLVGEKAVACGEKVYGKSPRYEIQGVPLLVVFKV